MPVYRLPPDKPLPEWHPFAGRRIISGGPRRPPEASSEEPPEKSPETKEPASGQNPPQDGDRPAEGQASP